MNAMKGAGGKGTGRKAKGIRGELVKTSALARFFEKPPEEVVRMRLEDGLPFVQLPGKNKPSFRYFLPEVHEWLCRAAQAVEQPKLKDYARFRAAFFAAQEGAAED